METEKQKGREEIQRFGQAYRNEVRELKEALTHADSASNHGELAYFIKTLQQVETKAGVLSTTAHFLSKALAAHGVQPKTTAGKVA